MKKKLLLVEDCDSLRRVMGSILSANYTVLGAKNGLNALGVLSRGEIPDLIVTDADMPELDGVALMQHLQCSGMYAHIPVLVLGEHSVAHGEVYYKNMGAKGFLPKPLNLKDFEEKILKIAGTYSSWEPSELLADTASNVVFG